MCSAAKAALLKIRVTLLFVSEALAFLRTFFDTLFLLRWLLLLIREQSPVSCFMRERAQVSQPGEEVLSSVEDCKLSSITQLLGALAAFSTGAASGPSAQEHSRSSG